MNSTRTNLLLPDETIKKGKYLALSRDTSLSELVAGLIEREYSTKEVIENIPASEVDPSKMVGGSKTIR